MAFTYVADGIDDVLAAHLNQYADAWSGVAGKGVPFNAVAVNDPINFAISARNLDPTNSRAAQFLKADGTVLFQCDASGVKVSPDGTVASVPVTATATQTLTNKTFTSPTLTGTVAGGAIYTAPHLTSPVVDSGGLVVTAGGLTVTAGNVGIGAAPQTGATSAGLTVAAVTGANTENRGLSVATPTGALTNIGVRIAGGSTAALVTDAGGLLIAGAPTASAGFLGISNTTATTATAGAQALPANPAGFLSWFNGATTIKIPYYNA